jgi:NADP-dependent 3-hydroxy acid dehydrogenase YdfG
MTQARPVVIVTGVGPGTGAAIARRFARGDYAVAMLARDHTRLTMVKNAHRSKTVKVLSLAYANGSSAGSMKA